MAALYKPTIIDGNPKGPFPFPPVRGIQVAAGVHPHGHRPSSAAPCPPLPRREGITRHSLRLHQGSSQQETKRKIPPLPERTQGILRLPAAPSNPQQQSLDLLAPGIRQGSRNRTRLPRVTEKAIEARQGTHTTRRHQLPAVRHTANPYSRTLQTGTDATGTLLRHPTARTAHTLRRYMDGRLHTLHRQTPRPRDAR